MFRNYREYTSIGIRQGVDEEQPLYNLPYTLLPTTEDITNTTKAKNYGRELANSAKMYTEDSKYCGQNDNFNFKFNTMIFVLEQPF